MHLVCGICSIYRYAGPCVHRGSSYQCCHCILSRQTLILHAGLPLEAFSEETCDPMDHFAFPRAGNSQNHFSQRFCSFIRSAAHGEFSALCLASAYHFLQHWTLCCIWSVLFVVQTVKPRFAIVWFQMNVGSVWGTFFSFFGSRGCRLATLFLRVIDRTIDVALAFDLLFWSLQVFPTPHLCRDAYGLFDLDGLSQKYIVYLFCIVAILCVCRLFACGWCRHSIENSVYVLQRQ